MAKKSSIEKNNRRRRLTKKFSGRRTRLKAIARDKTKPIEERFAATRPPRASAIAARSPAGRAAFTASTSCRALRSANSARRG
jgi:hypothetical protein